MKRWKNRKMFVYIMVGAACLLAAFTGGQYEKRFRLQRQIADKIIRFHVIANSDTGEDQELKLAVRDAVGAALGERLAGADSREASEKILEREIPRIEQTAREVVAEAGYDYEVTASLTETDFPVKTYGSYTFPAGEYEALEIVIGEGAGHNWWCVMYPNMCFSGRVYEVVDEAAESSLKEVLSAEEYEEVFSSGNYRVRFRYLDFLNELCGQNLTGNEE